MLVRRYAIDRSLYCVFTQPCIHISSSTCKRSKSSANEPARSSGWPGYLLVSRAVSISGIKAMTGGYAARSGERRLSPMH